jgi:hypothetical protein
MSFAHLVVANASVRRNAQTLHRLIPVFRKHVTHGEIRRFNEPHP